ncbi:MAG: GNAT family N-acetyltransferase [Gammaproteobacteria bacterium]|nr:GNAT family N-acetyltransferase [Gammaproteobacteria bacterium]
MTAESAETEDTGYLIAPADWPGDAASLRAIRDAVFVRELGISPDLEWDGLDPDCAHLLAYDMDGNPIGTARMQADGHIGRMAVLPEWRGVGGALLLMLIELAAAHNLDEVYLDAQTQAAGFYHLHGFIASGDEFEAAGIPHIRMTRFTTDP